VRILVAGYSGATNGIETYTRHLVASLQERGHDVLVTDRSHNSLQPAGTCERIQVGAPNRRMRRLVGPFESVMLHQQLRQLARDRDCDVVHATYPEYVFPGRPPTVVSAWHPVSSWWRRAATAGSRDTGRRAEALYALSDALAYRRAAVIALSLAVQRDLRARGQPAEWIPPFMPDALIRRPAATRSRTCVLIARWLDMPRKGLDLAITATGRLTTKLPGLQLLLVGGWRDPTMTARLPSYCQALGLRSPGEIGELLADAGCCVIASRWEEFGYSGLEALAAGAPLACPPLPGFEGLDGDGIVVAHRRDPAALADAIGRALEVETCKFPASCRSSVAIPQIEKLYLQALETGSS
jgi:glycosyltransferase involved in cell wall biosynthesis